MGFVWGEYNSENNLTIGGLRVWQILSLAMLQMFQKGSVNQTEIVVVTKVSLVKDLCREIKLVILILK